MLSELKNRGWVNSLMAGVSSGAKGFSFFVINVDLTEDGMLHTDDIVTLMFQVSFSTPPTLLNCTYSFFIFFDVSGST